MKGRLSLLDIVMYLISRCVKLAPLMLIVFMASCASTRVKRHASHSVVNDSTSQKESIVTRKNTSLADLAKTNAKIKIRFKRYIPHEFTCTERAPTILEEYETEIDYSKEEESSEESEEESDVSRLNETFSKSETREDSDTTTDVKVDNPIQNILIKIVVFILAILFTKELIQKL